MRSPKEEFLAKGDESCEDVDSEKNHENGVSQKDDGSVEENGSL